MVENSTRDIYDVVYKYCSYARTDNIALSVVLHEYSSMPNIGNDLVKMLSLITAVCNFFIRNVLH